MRTRRPACSRSGSSSSRCRGLRHEMLWVYGGLDRLRGRSRRLRQEETAGLRRVRAGLERARMIGSAVSHARIAALRRPPRRPRGRRPRPWRPGRRRRRPLDRRAGFRHARALRGQAGIAGHRGAAGPSTRTSPARPRCETRSPRSTCGSNPPRSRATTSSSRPAPSRRSSTSAGSLRRGRRRRALLARTGFRFPRWSASRGRGRSSSRRRSRTAGRRRPRRSSVRPERRPDYAGVIVNSPNNPTGAVTSPRRARTDRRLVRAPLRLADLRRNVRPLPLRRTGARVGRRPAPALRADRDHGRGIRRPSR